MKRVLLATCLFLSSNAFAQPIKVSTCKAVTSGLVAYPGDPNDVKNTVIFGEAAELRQDPANNNGPILVVELKGYNTYNKPVSKTIQAEWASAMGGTYYEFSMRSPNADDQIPYVKFEVEVLTDDGMKTLLSALVTENVINNGKKFKRYYATRYMCDTVKP